MPRTQWYFWVLSGCFWGRIVSKKWTNVARADHFCPKFGDLGNFFKFFYNIKKILSYNPGIVATMVLITIL